MSGKLILTLSGITLVLFFLNIYYKGNTVKSCLLFIFFLIPFMDLKVTPEAWAGLRIFDVICIYTLIALFKDFTTIDKRSGGNFYLFLFIALSIVILIGGLASEFPDNTVLKLVKTFPVFIFGRFFVYECLKDSAFHTQAIRALKASYIAALCFLFIQVIVGLKFTFYPGLHPNTIDPIFKIVRYPGIFYDSQAHSQYLAIGCFLFLYIEDGASRRTRLLNYSVFVLAILGLTMAGGRAAFGGFLLGLFLVFIVAGKQYRIYGAAAALVGFAVYSLVLPESGVFDRAKNLSEDYLFRESLWKEAWEISKKHPYLGIGTGNYQNYVIRHAQNQYLELEEGQLVYFNQPENGYLTVLVELGFIGFGIFMLFILVPIIRAFIYLLYGWFDTRVVFLIAGLISWMVAFNTVYLLGDHRILILVASLIVLLIVYPVKEYRVYNSAQ